MKTKTLGKWITSAALALLAVGCSEDAPRKTVPELTLTGAGASFPAPVYQSWTHTWSRSTPGRRIHYQSIGSGAGVNQLLANTVDFAGTDNPLTLEEQRKNNVRQFPMLLGGVVVIVNVPGISGTELRLNRSVLADLFLGKITRWNDLRIARLNPKLQLPDLAVTVVHRADASGTTSIFTDYLTKISEVWKTTVGSGASVKWPVGLGGQKNPGVCNNVARIKGAIGYTEFTYAVEAGLTLAQLENRDGKFVVPAVPKFRAAAAGIDWRNTPGFRIMLTDSPGPDAWPVTGVTFLVFRNDLSPEKKSALAQYVHWCFTTGAATAEKLNYVPLPDNVAQLVRQEVLQ